MIFFLTGVGFIVRLAQIQLIDGKEHRENIDSVEYLKEDIPAERGLILDRNGIVLATHKYAYSIYAKPYIINERNKVLDSLVELLKIEDKDLLETRLRPDRRFAWIKRRASPEVVENIRKKNINGIGIFNEEVRFYPYGNTASNLIGYVDFDGKACSGIELGFDEYLRGFPGWRLAFEDAMQFGSVPVKNGGVNPEDGMDVELTIDINVQSVVERVMKKYIEEYDANGGCAIVMEVKTGEVIALASYPDYDPNHYNETDMENYICKPINWMYEPGSSIKPLIMAIALEEEVVGPYTVIDCKKPVEVDNAIIQDIIPHNDFLSVDEILTKSSNIGMSRISMNIPGSTMIMYLNQLGFGNKSGIFYPGELDGVIHKDWMIGGNGRIFASFGQGLGVTPIQMISAMNVIANNGLWIQPRIVKSVVSEEETIEIEGVEKRRIFSDDVCNSIKLMMEDVVEYGGGKKARIEGYRVAGKTGTSQKVKQGEKEYSDDAVVANFIGFAPVEDPEFITLVIIDEPGKSYFGSQVAAPAFKEIMRWVLNYYNIPPEGKGVIEGKSIVFPVSDREVVPKLFDDTFSWNDLTVVEKTLSDDNVKVVPNLCGLSIFEAYLKTLEVGTTIYTNGVGSYIVKQNPEQGSKLTEKGIEIWLSDVDEL
jgi:cell division protein FtsI/penicillin-binding protein 2